MFRTTFCWDKFKREENYYQNMSQQDEPATSFGKLIIFDDLDCLRKWSWAFAWIFVYSST